MTAEGASKTEVSPKLELAAVLSLLAAVLIAFRDVVSVERRLTYRDHSLVFRPLWWSAREQILSGQLPVLNLASPSGFPAEWSTNNAVYTPMTLLVLPFSFDVGYDLLVLGHVLLLALGAYVLARSLELPWASAVFVGVASALAGPSISFESLFVGLQSLAWVPWVIWAFVRVLRQPGASTLGTLGLLAGFQAQALLPEHLLLDVLLAGTAVAWLRPKATGKLAGALFGATLIAGAVASLDVLPLLEALRNTERGVGFSYEERSGWALVPPLGLLELIAPNVFAPMEYPFVNTPSVTGSAADPPYFPSLYLGLLIPLALAAPKNRKSAFLAAMGLGFLVVSMGQATPLHRWVASLPLLASSRYAIKYSSLTAVALTALGAMTLTAWSTQRKWVAWASGLGVLMSLLAMSYLSTDDATAWLRAHLVPCSSLPAFEGMTSAKATEAARSAMHTRLLHGGLMNLVLFMISIRPTSAVWASVAVLLDLSAAAGFAIRGVDVDARPIPELLTSRDARVFLGRVPPIRDVAGRTAFESLEVEHAERGFRDLGHVRRFFALDVDGQGIGIFQRAYESLGRKSWEQMTPILRRAGVRFVVAGQSLPLPQAGSHLSSSGAQIHLFEIQRSLPYAYALTKWKGYDPLEAGRAFEETSLDVAVLFDGAAPEVDGCPAEASRSATVSASNGLVRVQSACRSLLVVSEVAGPRWHATLDGRQARLRPAQVGYFGVEVPAGEHEVRFEYEPSTRPWVPISITGWMVGLVCVVWGRRKLTSSQVGA